MDEPLSNLDAQLRVQMRVEILRLRSELGATFLYVTHDQVEAMTMGDRIVVMKDGCVQQVGTPREVYERPTNAFVAQFMGSPPMNLLPASMDGTVCAVEGGILRLALAERSLAEAGISPGQNVLVGIRPEGLHDARHSEVSGPSIDCRVELVEMLGSELYVHGRTADHKLTARLQMRSEDVIVGETVRLVVDERQIRLFDADTGRALGDRPLQTSHGPMKSAAL